MGRLLKKISALLTIYAKDITTITVKIGNIHEYHIVFDNFILTNTKLMITLTGTWKIYTQTDNSSPIFSNGLHIRILEFLTANKNKETDNIITPTCENLILNPITTGIHVIIAPISAKIIRLLFLIL